jgi:oligopeptide/dipeptide ABC transporter ATP-binding protein
MSLLDIENLQIRYEMEDGPDVQAVDEVSFSIDRGETFGLVGESGCGKTTLGKGIIKLLDQNGYVHDGQILFKDRDLGDFSDSEIRDVRWAEISTVPQASMSGLNPVYKVGDQIAEAILHHEPATTEEAAHERARSLLERVGVEADRADDYAHEFSGGMKQRAMIAMALSCSPDLIIADEPTTALDVIVQDQVLDELEQLQEETGVCFLVISHDISVIAETCDRVGVMYGGKLMEVGETEAVFDTPANPYTMGLKNSFPNIEEAADSLVSIPGTPPTLQDPPTGCRFRERCPFATAECETEHPPMYTVASGGTRTAPASGRHLSACYHLDRVDELRREAADESTWVEGREVEP